MCQKYTERSAGSPASADFPRYSGFSELGNQTRYVSSNERFNDLALQRCGQSRSSTDRFSSDRYLAGSSPAHDARLSSAETPRYIVSSTERLLAPTSSSPSSSSETGECALRILLLEREERKGRIDVSSSDVEISVRSKISHNISFRIFSLSSSMCLDVSRRFKWCDYNTKFF